MPKTNSLHEKLPEPISCGGVVSAYKRSLIESGVISIIQYNTGYGKTILAEAKQVNFYGTKMLTYVEREYIGNVVDVVTKESHPIAVNTNGAGECGMPGSGFGCGKNMLLNTNMYKTIRKTYSAWQIMPTEILIQEDIEEVHD